MSGDAAYSTAKQQIAPKSRFNFMNVPSPIFNPTTCATLGVYIYIASLALPVKWDVPLVAFALLSLPAVVSGAFPVVRLEKQFVLPVLVFFVATAVSTAMSEDIGRSLRFSAPLLPAGLLYVMVAEHFDGTRAVRILYVVFSAVGMALGIIVLIAIWRHGGGSLGSVVPKIGLPLLVEDNDSAFMAAIAPFSLAVIYGESRPTLRILATLSLLVTGAVVCFLVSRTATFTLVISLTCAVMLLQRTRRLMFGLSCFLGLLFFLFLIDRSQGSLIIKKFVFFSQSSDGILTGRIPLWRAAWAMFLDAPLLGHGPNTFVLLYREYLKKAHLPIPRTTIPWVHNLYLEVLAERGIIGFMALGFMLGKCGITARRLCSTASGDTRVLSAAALASLLGFCVAGTVESTFLRLWVVILLFTLLGVTQHLSQLQPVARIQR